MEEHLKEYLIKLPLKRVENLLLYINGKAFTVEFINGFSDYGTICEVMKYGANVLPLPSAPPGYIWKMQEKNTNRKSWFQRIFGSGDVNIELTFTLHEFLL